MTNTTSEESVYVENKHYPPQRFGAVKGQGF
jgi:hypothetical protein